MTGRIAITRHIFGHDIVAEVTPIGPDKAVRVWGGSTPRIGSMVLAWWEKSNNTLVVECAMRPNYEDYQIGEKFASRITEALHCCTAVKCGIHYEGLTEPQQAQLMATIDGMAQDLVIQLT